MGIIHLLDDALINKIAAGEVVERPASVVKELLENALDAHAKRILIELKEGGTSSIKVSDDGDGMVPEDAVLSITRHTTSKISDEKDLFSIKTLGFRGEALASIAAVSTMILKTSVGSEGTLIEVEAGSIRKQKPFVMPRGTTVIVDNLFSNVPARKKHLKSPATELSRCLDIVQQYALGHPDVYFELVHDGRVLLNCPATESLRERIAAVWGSNVATQLTEINHADTSCKVTGLISKTGYTRNDRSYQALFVNGRAVRSRIIGNAVYSGYKTFLNVGKHPLYVLNISISAAEVDVNVHPQKTLIRIERETQIEKAVIQAVSAALPEPERPVERLPEKNRTLPVEKYELKKEKQSFIQDKTAEFRVLGQVLHSYALVATKEGFFIVDQHAAAERVAYEKFLKQYRHKAVDSQELIEPLTLELSPAEGVIIREHRDLLSRLGFSVEDFGRHAFTLRTVPSLFNRIQGRDIFLAVLDELRNESSSKIDSLKEELLIRKACRSSIKANQRLETTELVDLLKDLFRTEQPYTCPHGRPTLVKFTQDDLERLFRRKGL
jgi:DNA mismatch repair protein MutL